MNRFTSMITRLLLVLAAGFAVACSPADRSELDSQEAPAEAQASTAEASDYANIAVEQLRDMLQEEEDPVLVNVHVPHRGDIPGTDLRIPFDEIGQHASEIPGGKDSPVVLYCRSGNMSRTAAEALVAQGYTHVYNLEGGRRAWQAAGY